MIKSVGQMRHRVDVLLPAAGLDERGQKAGQDTVVFAAVPCSLKVASGREDDIGKQRTPTATVQVDMWGLPGLTTDHYLRHGGRTFSINHIDDVDQNGLHYRLTCTEEPR